MFQVPHKWTATFSPHPPVNIIKLLNPSTRSGTRFTLRGEGGQRKHVRHSEAQIFYSAGQSVHAVIETGRCISRSFYS